MTHLLLFTLIFAPLSTAAAWLLCLLYPTLRPYLWWIASLFYLILAGGYTIWIAVFDKYTSRNGQRAVALFDQLGPPLESPKVDMAPLSTWARDNGGGKNTINLRKE